jgi:hypothetical protein
MGGALRYRIRRRKDGKKIRRVWRREHEEVRKRSRKS